MSENVNPTCLLGYRIHKPTTGIVSLEFASIQNAVYILR
jgi:hypothetical protein